MADDDAALRVPPRRLLLAFFSDYERTQELAVAAQRHARVAACRADGRSRRHVRDGVAREPRPLRRVDPAGGSSVRAVPCRVLAVPRPPSPARQAMYGAVLTGDVAGAPRPRSSRPCASPTRCATDFISGTVLSNFAWALGVAGLVDEGRDRLRSLIRSIDAYGPDVDVLDLRVTVGKLHLWAGELEPAIGWLGSAAQYQEPGDDNWTAVRALPSLAAALRLRGRIDDAGEVAARGVEMARRLGTPHAEAESLDELAHVVVLEDPTRGLDLYHDALAVRRACGLRTHLAETLDNLASVAGLVGDHLGSGADGRGFRRGTRRDGLSPPRRRAHVARADVRGGARVAGRCGVRRGPAREGASLDLDAALDLVSRARGARGRPATGWASLTPTELEVAALVAEGLTNPQVATRLLISRATVKTHVSHIFTKLGIGSRCRARRAGHEARRRVNVQPRSGAASTSATWPMFARRHRFTMESDPPEQRRAKCARWCSQ